ncbi:MAG: glycosyltransferase [bacterium]|nr:glycosyltransferase [bacterium]
MHQRPIPKGIGLFLFVGKEGELRYVNQMSRLSISLVIPAHNEEGYIGACLDFVFEYAHGKFDEIIVVDNASTDRTAEIARGKGARVVFEGRKGLTRARQKGLESVSSEYVAYIDADCRLTPEWFSTVEYHLAKHPNTVSLTGPVWYFDGPYTVRWAIWVLEWITIPLACWIAGYGVVGGNFVARRDTLIAVGGFSPDIAFYGEDTDIARRLAKHGYVLLRMNLVVATSMRRFLHDGFVRTCANYTVNALSSAFFHRPATKKYTDVRS